MPGKLGEVIKVICGCVAIFIHSFPESLNSVFSGCGTKALETVLIKLRLEIGSSDSSNVVPFSLTHPGSVWQFQHLCHFFVLVTLLCG